MTHESLTARSFDIVVARLGGADALAASAKETKALQRRRGFSSAAALLQSFLLYCLTEMSFRTTAAWAEASALADVSSVALWKRMANSTAWLELLVKRLLLQACQEGVPAAAKGRLIRCIDATTLTHVSLSAKAEGRLWRLHCAYDPQRERFSAFELTDERGGETIDRIPVVKGEICIYDRDDRAYLQPDRMARVIGAGADLIVRARWAKVRWLDADAEPLDIIGLLRKEPSTDERDRCLSPLGGRANPSLWRTFANVHALLIEAIVPALDLATFIAAVPRLRRHLREPPRKRLYQSVPP